MENKRKANGAAPVETDDRSSKRRKTIDFDLSKGETSESTTAHGLSFLEQIRKTADKNGRRVATNFEKLPPRQTNARYYKQTRMPISLGMVEEKLNNGEFETLSELESYLKRMIANAKEFYARSSSMFDDTERLRKAIGNLMVKVNPAYHNKSYQAVPTPLPPEASDDEENEEEDAEAEDNEEDVAEDEEKEEGDDDGEEEEEQDDEEDEEEEEEEDEEEEEEEEPKRRSIILKRRGPGRPPKNGPGRPPKGTPGRKPKTPREASLKKTELPDHEYKNVPYKGLTFQQAQEKIIEELIRHEEPEYEGAYFEPFINLPPRALKDYFKVITDPLSFKKFQRSIKGYKGRGGSSGISEFKTWAAFEEKAKLLWTNAYFYNEEGSDIYSLAQELEKFFGKELKKAQAVVSEPSQPKIKLKVGQTADSTPTPKKITIHVGGRGESADSAAPQAAPTTGAPVNGQAANGTEASTPAPVAVEKLAPIAVAAPSPSPSVPAPLKAEDSSMASPAPAMRPPSESSGQATPGAVKPPIPVVQAQPFQHNPLANGYMEQKRLRGKGKGVDDALISRVRLWPPPTMNPSQYAPITTVLPSPKEMQTSATVNLTPAQSRVLIATLIPDHLRNRQYSLWTMVNKQPVKATVNPIPGMLPLERCFEVHFHAGVNVVETHLIAAVPRSERVPGGPEVELEVFTVFVNVLRG